MKKIDSTLLFGGLIVLALGMALVFVPLSLRESSSRSNGEFSADWFAPATDEELARQPKLIGKPMPLLDLTQWRNGELKPDDLKGKVILIDFWATWCAPCIEAFPKNDAILAKYKPRGLEVLGICTNIAQDRFDRILADAKPAYPMARDEKLKTADAWTANSYPTYAVVDRKGNLRAIGLKHEYVEKVIEKLLAEPTP